MKTWTVKVLGREVLTVEFREEASIADVVRHMVARRLGVDESEIEIEVADPSYDDLSEGLIPCECCGEMFDPDEESEEDAEVNARFADMTERLIWGPQAVEEPDDEA
jgi:hypothetical protein